MKRSVHPDRGLFEYAAGTLAGRAAAGIETHLSRCGDCSLLVASLRLIKDQKTERPTAASHPSVGELADFFYESSNARRNAVAAHVAICADCARELAQYARAESAASRYQASRGSREHVPAAAWEMISEWEDSVLARPKDNDSIASEELLDKLSELMRLQRQAPTVREQPVEQSGLEAVTVIDRTGSVRTVELFQRVAGGLKHARQSHRYDDKPVHALLDFGEGQRVVVSDKVRGDRIELKSQPYPAKDLVGAAYFIVED